MDLDGALLKTLVGSTFLTRITQDDDEHAVLRIGSQRWSVHRLAVDLGVVHTRAARLLSAAAASIGAKNVRDLYQRSSPYTFAGIPGLGETTMYVLWRLFQANGLDPDKWASGDRDDALVSFHALKERERVAEARTQADATQRTRKERAAKHERAVAAELNK